MIKKLFFLIIIIFLIILPNNAQASTVSNNFNQPTISNIYKEGFYHFDNKNNMKLSLTLTTDTPTKIMILDDKMNIEFLTTLPYNYKFTLTRIGPEKTIGIIGRGEVAITFEIDK